MNKLFKYFIFVKILFFIFTSNLYTGAADVYKVTMKKYS